MVSDQLRSRLKGTLLFPCRDLLVEWFPLAFPRRPPVPGLAWDHPVINQHMHFSMGVRWVNLIARPERGMDCLRLGRRLSLDTRSTIIRGWCQALNISKLFIMTEQGGYRDDLTLRMLLDEAAANEEVLALHRLLPKLVVPVATGQPGHGQAKNIVPYLASGFRAIKLHPHQLRLPADAEEYDPYMELAASFGVPVQIHCGLSDQAAPERIIALSARHAAVPVVMIHTYLHQGARQGRDGLLAVLAKVSDALARNQNLHVDLSCHSADDYPLEEACDLLGADRILFGSDGLADSSMDWFRAARRLEGLRSKAVKIGPETSRRLFFDNAAKLYGLA